MEATDLKKRKTFNKIVDSRTLSFWNALTDDGAGGSNQHEAEEMALPNILLESESEERARLPEELEKMEEE